MSWYILDLPAGRILYSGECVLIKELENDVLSVCIVSKFLNVCHLLVNRFMWKFLVQSIVEYGPIVWNPIKSKVLFYYEIQEGIRIFFRSFEIHFIIFSLQHFFNKTHFKVSWSYLVFFSAADSQECLVLLTVMVKTTWSKLKVAIQTTRSRQRVL